MSDAAFTWPTAPKDGTVTGPRGPAGRNDPHTTVKRTQEFYSGPRFRGLASAASFLFARNQQGLSPSQETDTYVRRTSTVSSVFTRNALLDPREPRVQPLLRGRCFARAAHSTWPACFSAPEKTLGPSDHRVWPCEGQTRVCPPPPPPHGAFPEAPEVRVTGHHLERASGNTKQQMRKAKG